MWGVFWNFPPDSSMYSTHDTHAIVCLSNEIRDINAIKLKCMKATSANPPPVKPQEEGTTSNSPSVGSVSPAYLTTIAICSTLSKSFASST